MGGRGGSSGLAPTPAKVSTPSGLTLSDVQGMNDDALHDFLINVNDTDTPDFLNRHHLQKMIYALGLNDKPEIISQKEFDDLTVNAPFGSAAPILYRTVNDTTLSNGIHMSAKQIQKQFTDGDLTYVGDGIHGDGLYFSDSKSGSKMYGNGGGRSAIISGVLNGKARIITEKALKSEYDNFVKNHPRSRKALGFARSKSTHDSMSQFALIRGYNVIVSKQWGNENYYTVLDRSVISTTGKTEKF